ncbi:MAG: SDH family Clp fold serine proteinase [Aeromonas veronii]
MESMQTDSEVESVGDAQLKGDIEVVHPAESETKQAEGASDVAAENCVESEVSDEESEVVAENSDSAFLNCDVISYYGAITKGGYLTLSKIIEKKVVSGELAKNIILVLVTPGGDPDAGFRIGRALNHHYEKVSIMIPDICKSAGTLISVAAHELIIGDLGELGPLDVQLRKSDEIGELTSTLDIFKSITELQSRTLDFFRHYVTDIKYGSGIGTKLAADIASNLTKTVISPIAAQIDPIKIGEHHRALQIAKQYAYRLSEMSNNLRHNALDYLVEGYPCHSFVIDRSEAKKLFKNVRGTSGVEEETLYRLARHYLIKKTEENSYYLNESTDVRDFTSVVKSLVENHGAESESKASNIEGEE